MRKLFLLVLFLTLYTFGSLYSYTVKRGERPPIDLQALPDDAYEKGILKIKLDESLTSQLDNNPVVLDNDGSVIFNISAVDQLNEQYRPTGFKKLFECGAFSPEFSDRHRAWGFHLWYTLYFDERTDVKELVNAYEQLADVSIAEPQYKTELHSFEPDKIVTISDDDPGSPPVDTTSDDDYFSSQWHYHNTGQQSGTVDADIDLPEAWDIETGNPNVLVSIHDQGVQYTHTELDLNFSGLSYDFYNDDATISFGYHGTHVAGTVTAETNNDDGVAGVAGGWNSEGVNYMSAMVYLPGGGSGNGHHLAPVWAADNGACIEQNSWGYTSAGYYEQSVLDAIDYFNTNGGGSALSGGITIYAAGNHGAEGLYYPGCYSGTFSVAATNNQDIKSYYSTYGTWVDISAPGGETHVVNARGVYSTYTTSTYGYLQGTSMACPHVSGTAALIISMAYGLLTPGDVADILRNTTDDIDALNPTYIGKLGTGRLNAYQALLETQTYLVNTWDGSYNRYWSQYRNWSLNHVPTAGEDVIIPDVALTDPMWIDFEDAVCNNLTIASGVELQLKDQTLTVNGNLSVSGHINMFEDTATITVMGDVAWNSGSLLTTTVNGTYINVYGNWNFNSGANVNPSQGYIDFRGTTDSWIRCYSSNSSFYRLRNYKSGGAKAKFSNLCTEDTVINGLTFITTGAILESLSDYDVIMRGYFNYYGTFDFTLSSNTGSVIFDGVNQGINNYSSGSGTFNNIVFSSSTGTTLSNDNMTVMGDLTINQGYFSPGTNTVTVGGNWTNTAGTFTPGTSLVVFESLSGAQNVNGNCSFYDVQQVNTGQYLRFNSTSGATTILNNLELHFFCWAYRDFNVNGILNINDLSSKFTASGSNANATIEQLSQGGILTCNGTATLTVNDLAETRIIGTYYVDTLGGVLNLTNSGTGTYVDLNADLHISGGTMNITGSFCYWPYNGDASIEMDSGVLDVTSCGIYLSASNTLTETITGGTIRTAYGFTGVRTDFNPTGGTIELYGTIDASLSMGTGCNFYNVQINKSASDNIERKSKNERRTIQDRDGSVIELTRSNTVNAASELDINFDLLINNGTFNLNGNTVNVAMNVYNYGDLIVGGILGIGNDFSLFSGSTVDLSGTIQIGTSAGWHGNAAHNTGSTFNQTGGDYYVESIVLQDGSQFNGTGGITHIYVDGYAASNSVEIDDPDSYFYYFYVDSGASATLYNCSYDLAAYYTILYGPLDINSYTMNSTYVDVYGGGNLIIDSGGEVNITGNGPYFHSGAGSLTMNSGSELNSASNIQFQTGSTENVSGGEIFVAGNFTDQDEIFSPTGGSVIFDGSSASSIIGPTAFYDLNIDKTGATATANSSFSITNNLDITSGALTLNGYTVDVANDVDVYGTLNMTNAADILNVGDAAYDNLAFRNGSYGNLTAGVVNLASWLWVDIGGLLTATTGNTMNFNGPGITGIEVDAAGSVFGNINIVSVNPFRLYSVSSQLIEVDGNFDLQAGNDMEFMNNSMIVHGLFTDDPTSTVYVYDGPVDGGNTNLFSANGNEENQNDISIIENPKNSMDSRSRGGYFEIDTDFTLNGHMDVGNGDVLVHGAFELATTGTLTIDGGSFINDESARDRAWRYLQGTFNLSDGLFEITNNSTNFASTATTNISGGTIRTGGAFYGVHTGTFQPTGGIVEIIGGGGDNVVYCSNGNYFYDLVINRNPGIYAALMQETHVQNDLTINSGILSCNFTSDDLYVGGNWINNVGTGGFLPNTNTVIFDGTDHVSITLGETFYNLTLDKVSSADQLDLFGPVTVGNDLTINPGALYSNDNTISVSGNVIVNSGGVLYMEANSTLEIGDAKSLNVFGGGTLEVNGESGAYATVTRSTTGAYGFNVYSGGTMGADWAIFEYMNGNGVFLTIGSLVDPVLTFNNCIFRNGYAAPSALFAISNDATFTSSNTYFENTLGTTGWNVWKNNDDGEVTFVSATGDFAGPDYESDPYNHIHWDGYNPDLDITNVNWTDTNPYVCDMITVSITVYNNGNVDIPGGTGFYVDLYYNLSSPPASFETGDQAEYITSGIPAGDFIVVDFDVVNDVVESWTSYVQVDTDEDITELNEGNNVWGPDAVTWNPFPVINDLTIQYNVGTNEIELNWTYPITVDQYIIYRSTDPYDFAGADVFTSSTESYSETALGTKYFYHVTAERTCTASDNSYKEKTERSRKR